MRRYNTFLGNTPALSRAPITNNGDFIYKMCTPLNGMCSYLKCQVGNDLDAVETISLRHHGTPEYPQEVVNLIQPNRSQGSYCYINPL